MKSPDSAGVCFRQKPATSYDKFLRDVGTQYVKGSPTFADLYENAPFTE